MTVLYLPGFGPDPDDEGPAPGDHVHPDDPLARRDDGGWALEQPNWIDYPPQFKDWRPGQLEAVEQAVEAFNAGYRTVLFDGPTGVGKTYTANGVRAQLNVPTTYSCHSLNLQYQWGRDFAPYPILMGRSNYDIRWPGTPKFITAADCTWNGASPEAGCHWCPDKKVCPYERAKARALAAPFRCVNHTYLVTEAAYVGRFLSEKKPTELLIIDEAEMLENALLGQVSVTFPAKLRDELALGSPQYVTKEESIKEWLGAVVIPALKAEVARFPRDTTDRRLIRARDAAANRLGQTEFVLSHYDKGWVFDRSSDNWALRPVWASHWGAKWIGTRAKRILAMSATLISGAQVATDLGLPEPSITIQIEGGFDPVLRPIYLAPVADLRSKGEEGDDAEGRTRKFIPPAEYDKLATGIRAVMARHPRDRILVHCHSYKVARELYGRLSSPRVFMYEGGGRDQALKTYLATDAAVLLAPSLERGVDLTDDKCRVVVWAKIPFPNLGDPVVRRRTYSGGPNGRRWYAVETIRAIVQGCGRAVRHNEDWAEIYVLDAAFMSLWRKERHLFPAWFSAAIRFDFDSRALMRDGERLTRILTARRAAGHTDADLRPAITGNRPRQPR